MPKGDEAARMSGEPTPLLFDDGKEAAALRTIGEVARALGIKQHVLRYWEQQFPMLQPLKRSGGRRYYRAEDVALVHTIDRLVNLEGYTLKGARRAIEEGAGGQRQGPAPSQDHSEAADAGAESAATADAHLIVDLRRIRDRLAAALA